MLLEFGAREELLKIYAKERAITDEEFSIDSSKRAKIMTPKNLLVEASNLFLDANDVRIKDKSSYSIHEIEFLEMYYNDYSWGNKGNSDTISFIRFVKSLSDSTKSQLLKYSFIEANQLINGDSQDYLLQRFISERCVNFNGSSVLAPVWEFVNHSSFAPSLRTSPYGVETPPIRPGPEEILFKYSVKIVL